jgi:hypothetical protein
MTFVFLSRLIHFLFQLPFFGDSGGGGGWGGWGDTGESEGQKQALWIKNMPYCDGICAVYHQNNYFLSYRSRFRTGDSME